MAVGPRTWVFSVPECTAPNSPPKIAPSYNPSEAEAAAQTRRSETTYEVTWLRCVDLFKPCRGLLRSIAVHNCMVMGRGFIR